MPRLFIGIPAPKEAKNALTHCINTAKQTLHSSVSWSKPTTWHLTLKFLDEIPQDKIPLITKKLSTVPFSPFSLHMGGAGFFPHEQRPRVAWVGVLAGKEKLTALAQNIGQCLGPLGYEPEKRPFQPHWTICRIKKLSSSDNWVEFKNIIHNTAWPDVQIEAFTLFESRLHSQGAVHTALAQYRGSEKP